jgi:Superinfection immunity protein
MGMQSQILSPLEKMRKLDIFAASGNFAPQQEKEVIWLVWAIGLLCILFLINQGAAPLLIVLALYFIPTIVAAIRRHQNAEAILVLNLFLGWTFIGWVLALVWACTNNCEHKKAPATDRG